VNQRSDGFAASQERFGRIFWFYARRTYGHVSCKGVPAQTFEQAEFLRQKKRITRNFFRSKKLAKIT
jgi:hypothetical protein